VRSTTSPVHAGAGRLVLTSEGLAWLAASLVLGVVGWFKSINLVLILAYMMAALLCANGLLARLHARRIAAARVPQPPLFAGETANVRITATNRSRRFATVSVEEHTGGESTAWFLNGFPGGASGIHGGPRVFPARGRYPSSLWVTCGFPLGLVRFATVAETGLEVVVLPAVGEVDAQLLRHWLLRQAGGDGRARKVLRRVTTDQADVRGVRPYRPGDPIRGIHWRSSARRGELMVREYDVAPSPELVLVVEPWLPDEPSESDRAGLEAALSLAASAARSWSRTFETRVTIAPAGEPESVRTAGPTEAALRDALVPLAASTGRSSFDVLGPRCFDRTLQRAARLVVSSRRNSPYAAALSRATGRPFLAIAPSELPSWYSPPTGSRTGGR
jgi:uncharacterized protein (DUF58 family)